MNTNLDAASLERKIRNMNLPDLRTELRNMGLSPAGGLETLRDRMMEAIKNPALISAPQHREGEAGPAPIGANEGPNNNNYVRPSGSQNVGNFLTDRPTSRVLQPPGGGSSFSFA